MLTVNAVAEGLPFEVGHDVEEEAVHLAGIVERQDVWVSEVGRGFDLGQETLRTDHSSEFRLQDFERHLAVVLRSSASRPSPCRPRPTHARWRSGLRGLRSGG